MSEKTKDRMYKKVVYVQHKKLICHRKVHKKLNTDKICISYNKLDHTDKVTINKKQYVNNESMFYGRTSDLINKIAMKHLSSIKQHACVGEYSLNQDIICLFKDGLDYFIKTNKSTLEQQIAKTLSHEIMHRILFYEHGEEATRMFDNITEDLKLYGMW